MISKEWTQEDIDNMTLEQAEKIIRSLVRTPEQILNERDGITARANTITGRLEKKAEQEAITLDNNKKEIITQSRHVRDSYAKKENNASVLTDIVYCPKCKKPAVVIDRRQGLQICNFKTRQNYINMENNFINSGNVVKVGCPWCGKCDIKVVS